MNKNEFIKLQKEKFDKRIKSVFDKEPFVIIFTDAIQSSCHGHFSYCDMYSGYNSTWVENFKRLFNGTLRYYIYTIDKWFSFKCKCGCNAFYFWNSRYVCSECFETYCLSIEGIVNTFVNKEDSIALNKVKNVPTIRWHKFGIIDKNEFDEFMKDCTNPEQIVYW